MPSNRPTFRFVVLVLYISTIIFHPVVIIVLEIKVVLLSESAPRLRIALKGDAYLVIRGILYTISFIPSIVTYLHHELIVGHLARPS